MKIKTSELTSPALDWAVARSLGFALQEPAQATNADVEHLPIPFNLYEANYRYHNDVLVEVTVDPITVTRYGVNTKVGATAPSISFTDCQGRKALGSVNNYFLTREQAAIEVQAVMVGNLDGWHPSTDWSQGGPIIEQVRINMTERTDHWFADCKGASEVGPTPLIAAMRCFCASRLGDGIEIPDELLPSS